MWPTAIVVNNEFRDRSPQMALVERDQEIKALAVVNHEPVRVIKRQELAELLDGPFRGRMRRDVGVQNPAGADLHRDKDVQDSERCRYGHEEVARDDGVCMSSHENRPSLPPRRTARPE